MGEEQGGERLIVWFMEKAWNGCPQAQLSGSRLRDEEFKGLSMKRLVHKAKNHREARKWDIMQQIAMSPEERQRIASELKRRFYGSKNPDVRKWRSGKGRTIE
jgi:hypothetical protein